MNRPCEKNATGNARRLLLNRDVRRRVVNNAAVRIAAWCCATASMLTATAAEPWSVSRLLAAKAEWERLSDVPLTVEGRVSSMVKNQLRLQKCDLPFLLPDDAIRAVTNAKVVELSGRLQKSRETGKIVFEVGSLKALPADAEQLRSREAALRAPEAKDWYALAEWARERADLYGDDDLRNSARTYLARGFISEARSLPIDDFDAHFKLADRAAELQVPADTIDKMRHDVFQSWWRKASTAPAEVGAELDRLTVRMKKEWPEAFKPLPNWPTELVEKYRRDPTGTYAAADPLEQRQLRRVFGIQVQLKRLFLDAASDARDNLRLAEDIARIAPEQPEVAEMYRDKELALRTEKIKTASRQEALQLADLFRQRKRPEQATSILRQWLAAREQQLPSNDAPALVALADDYLQWLKDEPRAAALLVSAHRLEPNSEDIAARIRELGYEFRGRRWEKPSPKTEPQRAVPPVNDVFVKVGMTDEEVARKMGGPPASRTVIATAGGIDEWWSYAGGVIRLRRGKNDAQSRVVWLPGPAR